MKIGICGPVFLPMLRPYLNDDEDVDVKGMGGTPVNHQIIALLEKGYEVHVYSITPELLPGESRVWNGKNFRIYMGPFPAKGTPSLPGLFPERTSLYEAKYAGFQAGYHSCPLAI
jgi:hypothetical protein